MNLERSIADPARSSLEADRTQASEDFAIWQEIGLGALRAITPVY